MKYAFSSEEFLWRPSIDLSKYGCSWLELLWNYVAFHPLHVVVRDVCGYLKIQYLYPNSLKFFRILFRFIMRFINWKFTFRMLNMNFEVIHLRAAVHTLRLLHEDVWKNMDVCPPIFITSENISCLFERTTWQFLREWKWCTTF